MDFVYVGLMLALVASVFGLAKLLDKV